MKIRDWIFLYFNTVKYLKFSQIFFRFFTKLPRVRMRLSRSLPRVRLDAKSSLNMAIGVGGLRHSVLDYNRFKFLNYEVQRDPINLWNDCELPKLWLYNLHYFNDLQSVDSKERHKLLQRLVLSWIDQNPVGRGVGWEPYPLSIRIVNIIKWQLAHDFSNGKITSSLVKQIRHLESNIEHHLKGNHLFSNAKALTFAGFFFQGPEAARWLKKGMKILCREVEEQILSDGGHYERSPMYHALALEDMLDIEGLILSMPEIFTNYEKHTRHWAGMIDKMVFWLNTMTHPDGNISFFNDAAFGISADPKELYSYAKRLGHAVNPCFSEVVNLEESGYVRVKKGSITLLIDVAPVGPDYIPAHAHADSLSYEFSLNEQRIVVNSGTSHYHSGEARDYERGTSAHSTVEIDSENSSEVWHSFRVARRARVDEVMIDVNRHKITVSAKHDGYLRFKNKCIHRRKWIIDETSLEVIDEIEGRFGSAVSRHFLRPTNLLSAERIHDRKVEFGGLNIESETHDIFAVATQWFPEFGSSIPNSCLEMRMHWNEAQSRFHLKFLNP